MCVFTIKLMAQSAIRFSEDVDMNEGNMAVSLRLHSEPNVLVETV